MSWIDQLSEDLHLWSMRTDLSERERRIMHAARLVVEGEDIWWCIEHDRWADEWVPDVRTYICPFWQHGVGVCTPVLRRMIGGSDAAE